MYFNCTLCALTAGIINNGRTQGHETETSDVSNHFSVLSHSACVSAWALKILLAAAVKC